MTSVGPTQRHGRAWLDMPHLALCYQHLELARDIARQFNSSYVTPDVTPTSFFVEPQTLLGLFQLCA